RGREQMGPRDDRRRGRQGRHGLDRARRSDLAGPGCAPSDGRGLSRPGPAAAAHRAALRRGPDATTRDRRPARDRGRRGRALRGPRRAARRAGPDLGHRGIPRPARRAPILVAHHPGAGPGRRRRDQREEGRRDGAGPVGPAPSARILTYARGAAAASGTPTRASLSRNPAGVRAGRPSSVANAPVTSAVTSTRWLSASRISWIQIDRAPRTSRTYVTISSVSPERAGARYFTARSAARIK